MDEPIQPVAFVVAPPPPPPRPWKLYESVLGSLGLVVAAVIGYFVIQIVGMLGILIWLVANGMNPLAFKDESALAPYLPAIIAFSPLASIGVVCALALARQLAPHPGEKASPGVSALVTVLGCVATIAGTFAITWVQEKLGHAAKEQTVILEAFKECPLWMLYGAIAFMAPLGEELIFRRMAFATLRVGSGRFVAYALTALLFATVHMNFSAFFAYVWIGIGTAFVYERTGRIGAPIAVHAINNGFAIFMGT